MTSWIAVAFCAAASPPLLLLIVLRRQLVVVSVEGRSMLPTFQPGDRLLVRRGAVGRRLRAGTVAVLREPFPFPFPRPGAAYSAVPGSGFRAATARPPGKKLMIKRVAALPGEPVPESVREAVGEVSVVPRDMVVLLADNPAGTDSRYWGLVPLSYVVGSVVSRLSSG
jgi:signal peptidase I